MSFHKIATMELYRNAEAHIEQEQGKQGRKAWIMWMFKVTVVLDVVVLHLKGATTICDCEG